MRYTAREKERDYKDYIKLGCSPERAQKLVDLHEALSTPGSPERQEFERGMEEWNEALRPMLKQIDESTLNVNYNLVINTRQ